MDFRTPGSLIRWVSCVIPMCLLAGAAAANCPDDNYHRTDKGWTFARKGVEGADPGSFRVLTGPDPYEGAIPCGHDSGYAVDRFHAYWHGDLISGADPKTLSYLPFDYSRDASNVYYRTAKVSGADPRSFIYIDRPYFKDSAHVYLRGAAIKDADPATFALLSTTRFGENRLARDRWRVFFGAEPIPEANTKDAVNLGLDYWTSNRIIFFGGKPLRSADTGSFHLAPKDLDAYWAEDNAHYFVRDLVLNKAECRREGPAILACRTDVWVTGYKYSKLDAASMHYLGESPPKHCIYPGIPVYQDKHGVYFLTQGGMVERLLHTRQYPRIERLDGLNTERLRRLDGTADVWPDVWLEQGVKDQKSR